MNFVINIPFIKIRVYQAQKRHWRFFNDLLFQDSIDGKNIITIDIFFEKIKSKTKYILEKDAISDGQNFFYQDVKGNKVTINWSQLKVNYFKFIIDPNFDLYAFFTFILEPIFIILGAQNNILFLHASGVVKKNQALIFPAWRNTGKTNTILLECKRGSHFLGDDYVILKNKIAYLYPKALNLFSYNFEAFPEVYKYLPLLTILKLKLGIKFKNFLHSLSQSSNGYLSKTFYRLSELAEIATNIRLNPKFLDIELLDKGPITKITLLQKIPTGFKTIDRITTSDFVNKNMAIITCELEDFWKIFTKYQFFYPRKKLPLLTSFPQKYANLLSKIYGQIN